eukprot:CAMPEP_0168801086 /NCGR_PEP_ID=MMETSP0725-20121227/19358_1 /TAXON_ID=265536 /ORGANISM="Amphiprora sp., Strain CCMP467" /LENGTH=105 /DNA_ID=CAMNT_0008852759 /DNA_START=239 /DNA_END=557 /DNA_ORIENTATION=+
MATISNHAVPLLNPFMDKRSVCNGAFQIPPRTLTPDSLDDFDLTTGGLLVNNFKHDGTQVISKSIAAEIKRPQRGQRPLFVEMRSTRFSNQMKEDFHATDDNSGE